jgi:hypothetical protein
MTKTPEETRHLIHLLDEVLDKEKENGNENLKTAKEIYLLKLHYDENMNQKILHDRLYDLPKSSFIFKLDEIVQRPSNTSYSR